MTYPLASPARPVAALRPPDAHNLVLRPKERRRMTPDRRQAQEVAEEHVAVSIDFHAWIATTALKDAYDAMDWPWRRECIETSTAYRRGRNA